MSEANLKSVHETTADERLWAVVAHLSTLFTVLIGWPALGLLGVPFLLIPVAIYLAYREKSSFVARHAAQAFGIQVIGTVGYFALFLLGLLATVLVWVVSGLLVVILIGLLLLATVAPIVTLVYALALVVVPLAVMVLSVIAAVDAGNSRSYSYPYVGEWVDDWLDRHPPEVVAKPEV